MQLKKSKTVHKAKKDSESQPLTRGERLAVLQSEKEIKEGKCQDFADPDGLAQAIKKDDST